MDYDTKLKIGTKLINDLAEDVYTVDSVEYTHDHGVVEVIVKGYSLTSEFEIKHVMQASEFVGMLEEDE
jgi:hypothetical protein